VPAVPLTAAQAADFAAGVQALRSIGYDVGGYDLGGYDRGGYDVGGRTGAATQRRENSMRMRSPQ
jgi:hypothetical protein